MGDPEPLQDVLASSPLLLTPAEAATVLRIGRTTIYALMKAGDLRPVHIGRSCRLPRAELERYVDRLQAPPPPSPALRQRRGSQTSPHQGALFDFVHTPAQAE
ncbi:MULTISPECIES: helix-turn-helix domain-containing protein [unclassified Geodermatophilus]